LERDQAPVAVGLGLLGLLLLGRLVALRRLGRHRGGRRGLRRRVVLLGRRGFRRGRRRRLRDRVAAAAGEHRHDDDGEEAPHAVLLPSRRQALLRLNAWSSAGSEALMAFTVARPWATDFVSAAAGTTRASNASPAMLALGGSAFRWACAARRF